jgi:hypothetical protein
MYTATIDGTPHTRAAPVFTSRSDAESDLAARNASAEQMGLKARYTLTECDATWCQGVEQPR